MRRCESCAAWGPAAIGLPAVGFLIATNVLIQFLARNGAVAVAVDPAEVRLLRLRQFLARHLAVLVDIQPRKQVGPRLLRLAGFRRERRAQRGAVNRPQHVGRQVPSSGGSAGKSHHRLLSNNIGLVTNCTHSAVGRLCYHKRNRGNARAEVIRKPADDDHPLLVRTRTTTWKRVSSRRSVGPQSGPTKSG